MSVEMEALTDRSRRTSRSHISTQASQGGRVERCSRPKLRTAESATARGSRTTTTARAPGNRRGSPSRCPIRSAERRVGKEGVGTSRSRWARGQYKKKKQTNRQKCRKKN